MLDADCNSHASNNLIMITCRELTDFLIDYTSGDLPPNQRAEFERHPGELGVRRQLG